MNDFQKRADELVNQMTLEEKVSQMMYNSPAIERLGIPAYNWWNECLHGVARSGQATVFPQAVAMAASFNEDLLHEVAVAISDEARAKYNEYKKFGKTEIYQGLTFWSPNINIFRDPRWGRGHETYGEDPYLTGRMGTAFIKGLQGEDPKYRKLDATVKHYAVHSGPEKLRHEFNAVTDDTDLYDTYLEAFRYCIENADPSAVMSAYNAFEGIPCSANKHLLQDILRDEFGFEGYVVSDCGAITDIYESHKYTDTKPKAAALAVDAGCDLNCGGAYEALCEAVHTGLIAEEKITEACRRLFFARMRLGMFDEDCPYNKIGYDVIESQEHLALSEKMAQESIVLLKNNGILPLDKNKKVAVIGPAADNLDVLVANYNGYPTRRTTLLQGMLDAAGNNVSYARGCDHFRDTNIISVEEALIVAKRADVVVLTMGLTPLMEGEEGDAGDGDKKDLEFPVVQQKLIDAVLELKKPVVFVNVSGSCMNLCQADENCDAVIQCFYPGAFGGKALADIIYGNVSPSGRLPVTFYRNSDDLPDFCDYSMKNRTYRFFEGKPLYPFGHGLTYSKISETNNSDGTVTVKNEGPYDTMYSVLHYSDEEHPRLDGFKKIFIKNGETVTVDFN